MQEFTTFEKWMREVDNAIDRKTGGFGFGHELLPDVDYRGLYQTGNTPDEAADFAVENAKTY